MAASRHIKKNHNISKTGGPILAEFGKRYPTLRYPRKSTESDNKTANVNIRTTVYP